MKKIIRLMWPTGADDINCNDGEVEGGGYLFGVDDSTPATVPEGAPEVVAVEAALPPYCHTAGELPRLNIQVSVGSGNESAVLSWLAGRTASVTQTLRQAVSAAIVAAMKKYVADACLAGLYVMPVWAVPAMELTDGSLCRLNVPKVILPPGGPVGPAQFIVRDADCNDGILYLALEFLRRPFGVEIRGYDPDSRYVSRLLVSANVNDIDINAVTGPMWVTATDRGFTMASLPYDEDDFSSFKGEIRPGVWDAGIARNPIVPITTRPIKLGNPFTLKQLSGVEAIWPDRSRLGVKCYGAIRPGQWRFLGFAPYGRMVMRGSGWRFFRIETFALFDGSRFLLPTLQFNAQCRI